MNLLKSMSVYFFGSLINASIPFLLLPLFTKYLSVIDFGMLSLVQVFAAFAFPLVIVGIQTSINTEYFHCENKLRLDSYISSALIIPICSAALLSIVIGLLGKWSVPVTGISSRWMLASIIIALLQVIPTVVLFLLQASEKPITYGFFQIGMTLVNFAVSIFLVVRLRMNWEGRMFGILGTNILFSIIGLSWLYQMTFLTRKLKVKHIRDAFRFGLFLIPHEVGGVALQLSNRLIISTFVGIAMLGMYSVAYQVGSVTSFIAMAFNQAWIPYLFGNLSNITEIKKRHLVKLSYLFMLFFLIIAFLIVIPANFIFAHFINSKFRSAEPFVFWIALSFAFTGMYFVVVNYIIFEKKTHILAYITVSCGLASIAINYFFVRHWGIEGAVKAQALSSLLFFVATWIFSAKVYPMPWLQVFTRRLPMSE